MSALETLDAEFGVGLNAMSDSHPWNIPSLSASEREQAIADVEKILIELLPALNVPECRYRHVAIFSQLVALAGAWSECVSAQAVLDWWRSVDMVQHQQLWASVKGHHKDCTGDVERRPRVSA